MKEWLYCLPVAVFLGCLLFPFGVGMLPPERIEIYAFVLFSVYGILCFIGKRGGTTIRAGAVTVPLAVLTLYLSGRSLAAPVPRMEALLPVGFLCLCFLFESGGAKGNRRIAMVIVALTVIQALHGCMQYATGASHWVVGCLDNPAGYAASLVVGLPFCLAWETNNGWRRVLKVFCVLITLSAVVLSGSRAGIVTGLFVLGVFFWKKRVLRWRLFAGVSAVVLAAVIGSVLFYWKRDSAVGRVLIWKVSISMVAEAPVWGSGGGSFRAGYMIRQADFFKTNPESKYAQVAGNVFHPFTEYLLVLVEFGIVGLLLSGAVLVPIARASGQPGFTSFPTSIAAVVLFSCFSYPVHYGYVCAILAFCFANVPERVLFTRRLGPLWRLVIGSFAALSLLYCLYGDIRDEYRWNGLQEKTLSGRAAEAVEEYRLLYGVWNYNPRYLYRYGATLNYLGLYGESTKVLTQCGEVYNSYDLQMLLADNYYAEGMLDAALTHSIRASEMCPGRFRPLYMQMVVYDLKGQSDSALRIAADLSAKPVKVPSAAVEEIRSRANDYLMKAGSTGNPKDTLRRCDL